MNSLKTIALFSKKKKIPSKQLEEFSVNNPMSIFVDSAFASTKDATTAIFINKRLSSSILFYICLINFRSINFIS